jgi:N-methylhydantoinase A
MTAGTVRIGIDTGGTFTDVVIDGPDGRRVAKTASTPDRPARAFLAALGEIGGVPAGARLHHGTTVGTNAVLTRSGAWVLLVTTAGFEDLPWIGRGARDDLHALEPRRTEPLLEGGGWGRPARRQR